MKKINANPDVVKPRVFKLLKKRTSPATENNFYPGIKRIPSTDEIYDPKTNKKRIIRYSQSEQSVFKDEQPLNIELSDIIFTNGSLRVYDDNPTLVEYLRLCNWNRDNKSKVKGKAAIFYEYDAEKMAADSLEKMNLEIDAQYKAKTMDFGELKSIALALGFHVGRSSDEIRHDMVIYAKQKPLDFMNAMNSPELQRRVEIQECVELGILSVEPRSIKLLSGTGQQSEVVPVPVGVNPTDHLVVWSMNTKEGEEFFKNVISLRKKMLA